MADTSKLTQDHTRRRPSEGTVRRRLLRPAGAIRPVTVCADASSPAATHEFRQPPRDSRGIALAAILDCVAVTVTSQVPRQPGLSVRQAAAQPILVRRVPD
jgi:hypothetical protein